MQIKQQERSYFRLLWFVTLIYGRCYLALHACIPIHPAVKTGQPHMPQRYK